MGTNDVTGDKLVSKVGDQNKYAENYDKIFSKKKEETTIVSNETIEPEHCPHWVLGYMEYTSETD